MSTEKDVGIVLRVVPFSETSSVVWLFTRRMGRINALAKGARRRKSQFEAALDLLAVCRIVFIHKSSTTLDLLTEAQLERRFRAASRDLSCLYAGYYVAELLQELTSEADPHPELFDVAESTLRQLDHIPCEVARHVLRFELCALRLLGHLPSLDKCVECGASIPESRRIAFAQLAGGVLCAGCKVDKRQIVSVSWGVIQILRQFADTGGDDWRGVAIQTGKMGELRGVLNRYLSQLVGRRSRMHEYLGILGA